MTKRTTAKPKTTAQTLYGYRYYLGLVLVMALALYFRLWDLGNLPAGLSAPEAAGGITALGLIHNLSSIRQLLIHSPGPAMFSLLQAAFIKVLGNSAWALRLPSALIGTIAVYVTYLWASAWFDRKVGLVTALFAAVTPWTVAISRLGIAGGAMVIMVPGVLWLLTKAARSKSKYWQIGTGLALAACACSITGLWFLAGLIIIAVPVVLSYRSNPKTSANLLLISGILLVMGAPLLFVRFHHANLGANLKSLSLHRIVEQAPVVVNMFNLHGDNDFHFNISGAPELNLFVSLMFVIGLLVCCIRLSKAHYRSLLILFVALTAPIIIQTTGTPNSLGLVAAAPVAMILAALGIDYMLNLWYSTFPINSAARVVGTAPIVLLILICVYQGYNQYFVAWAKSPEAHDAYNEPARAIADYLDRTKFDGLRYVISSSEDQQAIYYLSYHKTTYAPITETDIPALATDGPAKQIIFTTNQPGDIVKVLKSRFPKSHLSQHYSEFNDNSQIFAVFQTLP